jgi:hypothetical protein
MDLDSAELWKRVGLEELRATLTRVRGLTEQFEGILRTLPPCTTCARASLLRQIETGSRQLGGEAISLAVLAQSLQEAVAAAENVHDELQTTASSPCACPSNRCICHG